jgi:hypothetical protein
MKIDFTPLEQPQIDFKPLSQSAIDFRPLEKPDLRVELAAVQGTPEVTTGSQYLSEVGRAGSRVVQGLSQLPVGTLKFAGAIADAVRRNVSPGASTFDVGGQQSALTTWGQELEKQVARLPGTEDQGLWSDVQRGYGQLLGAVGGGTALKLAGATVPTATAAATVGMLGTEFDDAYQRSLQRGDTPDLAFGKAFGSSSIATLIENAAGVGRVLRLAYPTAASAAKKLKALGLSWEAAKNFLVGFGEEASQRAVQDIFVEGKVNVPATLYEGTVGSLVQGPISTVAQQTPRLVEQQVPRDIGQITSGTDEVTGQPRPVPKAADSTSMQRGVKLTPQTVPPWVGSYSKQTDRSSQSLVNLFYKLHPELNRAVVEAAATAPAAVVPPSSVSQPQSPPLPLSDVVNLSPTPPVPAAAIPAGTTISPQEFVPALRTPAGEVLIGQVGQVHDDIYNAQEKTKGLELRVDQPEHGFVHKGKFLSRQETSALLGETKPMNSERLLVLQQKGGDLNAVQEEKGTQEVTQVPDWVTNLEAISEINRNDGQRERLTEFYKTNLGLAPRKPVSRTIPRFSSSASQDLFDPSTFAFHGTELTTVPAIIANGLRVGSHASPTLHEQATDYPVTLVYRRDQLATQSKGYQNDLVVTETKANKPTAIFINTSELPEIPAVASYDEAERALAGLPIEEVRAIGGLASFLTESGLPEKGFGAELAKVKAKFPRYLKNVNHAQLARIIKTATETSRPAVSVAQQVTKIVAGLPSEVDVYTTVKDEEGKVTKLQKVRQGLTPRGAAGGTVATVPPAPTLVVGEHTRTPVDARLMTLITDARTELGRGGQPDVAKVTALRQEALQALGGNEVLSRHIMRMEPQSMIGWKRLGELVEQHRPTPKWGKVTPSVVESAPGETMVNLSQSDRFSEDLPGSVAANELGLRPDQDAYTGLEFTEKVNPGLTENELEMLRFLRVHFKAALRGTKLIAFLPRYERQPAYSKNQIGLGLGQEFAPHELARTFLEEAAHAATSWVIHADSTLLTPTQRNARVQLARLRVKLTNNLSSRERAALTRLQALYNAENHDYGQWSAVWQSANLSPKERIHLYALINDDETIGVAFSSLDYRQWLREQSVGERSTAWDVVKDIIRKLLNVMGARQFSALEDLLSITAALGEGPITEKQGQVAQMLSKPRGAMPTSRFTLSTKESLPNLPERSASVAVLAEKFGAERIPFIGKLMGGLGAVKDAVTRSVATWFVERHGIAEAIASAVGLEIQGKVNKVFKVTEDGDMNVGRTIATQSLKTSDVFEALQKNPLAYVLTDEQRTVLDNVIPQLLKRMGVLSRQYKLIGPGTKNDPYFMRGHALKLDDKGDPIKRAAGGTTAMSRQPFQAPRTFTTEEEGWAKEFVYERDIEKRLVTGVRQLYRGIADKRLLKDPTIGARSRQGYRQQQLIYFADRIIAREISTKGFEAIVKSQIQKGTVYRPSLDRYVFPPDVAKVLNQEFASEQSRLRQVAEWNSFLKAIRLGHDLGVSQIQLLPTFFRRPDFWARAVGLSFVEMVKPGTFAKFVNKPVHQPTVRQLAQLGSAVGRLEEFISGAKGHIIQRIPGLNVITPAFARQFQTGLDVAKILWFESLRKGAIKNQVPQEEWLKLARTAETLVLSGRMESAGVNAKRALTERVLLMAPSYYRASLHFIAEMAETQPQSRKALLTTMGTFIAGQAVFFYAVGKALGMDDDDLKRRMNPTQSDFMAWRVPRENGSALNIGFGGIFKSIMRLFATTIQATIDDPKWITDWSLNKNPLMRWYRSHSSPAVGSLINLVFGENFLKKPTGLLDLIKTVPPIWLENVGREKPPISSEELVAEFFGMTTNPESYGKTRALFTSQATKELFPGRQFEQLNQGERLRVDRQVSKEMTSVPKDPMSGSATYAVQKQVERTEKLRTELPKTIQKALDEANLTLPGYQTSLQRGGQTMRLTETEGERLFELMKDEYVKALTPLLAKSWEERTPQSRKALLSKHLEMARRRAWVTMRREMPETD